MGPSGHGPRRPGPVALRRTRQWGERFSCRIAWLSSEIYVKLFLGHYTSDRNARADVAPRRFESARTSWARADRAARRGAARGPRRWRASPIVGCDYVPPAPPT